ncbi:GOLPH3/VPS74 family protein [Microlunatus soli]|uniref:Golgi phosphoprotein 3 (GPP34) n=1 Tax=Microlunatus soli TaxID=630515 RepID=A0A1H2AKV8_9ACTN|nr:GPP34 family phosphoprotein [Microlunatus soli]SDT46550.1 Golgi phosphoprotein 3 (GPP34) [Microlunatus soli]
MAGRRAAGGSASGRRAFWRPIPWWLAIPFAIVFGVLAVVVAEVADDRPMRPDVGYVVSQPDFCHIGVAADPDADRPDVTISSKSGDSCTRWDKGTRLYYNAAAPRVPPGQTPGTGNRAWGIAILVILAAIGVASAVHDLVLRRRRRAARDSQAAELAVRPLSPGKTYDRISTAEDLVSIALDPGAGRVALGGSDRVLGGALLVDLARAGAVTVTGTSAGTRVEVLSSVELEDPMLRAAQWRLRSQGLEGEQPENWRERLLLSWFERRNTKPLKIGEACSRLTGEHLDLPAGEVRRQVLDRVTSSGAVESGTHQIDSYTTSQPAPLDELRADLQAVLRGERAPDQRTGSLIALLDATGRLDLLGTRTEIDPRGVADGEWADDSVRAIISGVRAPQGS